MSTVEIYKDEINSLWFRDETFLCVFDKKNKLVADYDFCSGLRVMQTSDSLIIYINDEDLASGRWVLYITKVSDSGENEKIQVSGIKDGSFAGRPFDHEYSFPWNGCDRPETVSKKERQDRLSVCNKCPFFDSKNVTCLDNEKNVLEFTKLEDSYCPKEKWGNKEEVLKRIGDRARELGLVKPLDQTDEQKDFEADLEKFLEGM